MMRTKRINSRAKGANGELEFSRVIYDLLGVKLERNLTQTRSGGHDLYVRDLSLVGDALNEFAIEIKRHESATKSDIARWWEQTKANADKINKIPCLAYRLNRQDWRVIIPIFMFDVELSQNYEFMWTMDISVDAFAMIIRERI